MGDSAVDHYLEEKLIGSKEAVSTTLLSFELGQTLAEASNSLQSFYESHSDLLDASYKIRTKENAKTCIKLIPAKDLEAHNAESSRIWILSPYGAADKAVVTAVSAKVAQLHHGLSIGRLRYLGVATNPLLEDGFTLSDGAKQSGFHKANEYGAKQEPPAVINRAPGPTEDSASTPKKIKLEAQEPENSPKKVEPDTLEPENIPKKVKVETREPEDDSKKVKVETHGPEDHSKKAPTKKKTSTAAKQSKPAARPSFFSKTTKREALKSVHRKSTDAKPVPETVVISDETSHDPAADADEEEPARTGNLSREEQLRKLKERMLEEEPENQGSDEEMSDYQSDDLGDRVELGDHIDNDATADMDVDNVEPNTREEHDDSVLEDLAKKSPSLEHDSLKNDARVELNPPKDRTSPSGPEKEKSQRPQTRRVKKEIVRKDEEGFDIHEEVWVDEPIEDRDEAELHNEQINPESHNVDQASTKREAMTDSENKKEAKAPPKIPSQKKQKTLMSFFGKK